MTFISDSNRVTFNQRSRNSSLHPSDTANTKSNERVIVEYLRHINEANIENHVRSLIIRELSNGIPKQNKIARSLNISSRTLKRRLAAVDTSYAIILEETQCDLATQYLDNTQFTIGEISELLGYSEPSNFSRSFKKWTRQTPFDYRECNAPSN